ncbi:hypothetical protein K402DRAFT_314889, partial [Aulographum hederae CBS 113979]
MINTRNEFVDGLVINVMSPDNRTLTVDRNMQPLNGTFVTGSTGGRFRALQRYSYLVRLDTTPEDLVASMEIPFDMQTLKMLNIDPANTYVGKLADNGKSWVVSESLRNIHTETSRTRAMKMNTLGGEYQLLGRTSEDLANIFQQYGEDERQSVRLTSGQGMQAVEFIDGMRVNVQTDKNIQMN